MLKKFHLEYKFYSLRLPALIYLLLGIHYETFSFLVFDAPSSSTNNGKTHLNEKRDIHKHILFYFFVFYVFLFLFTFSLFIKEVVAVVTIILLCLESNGK